MRKYNFYPGPSTIPAAVLERMQAEMLEYGDTGAGFMELSHRGSAVLEAHARTVAKLRALLEIGDEYHVLILPGSATGQGAGIPMNLLRGSKRAAYAVTGHWGKLAAANAEPYCEVARCADTYPDCTTIPDVASWEIPDDCAYVHYTDNETIHGVEFPAPPALDGQVLVADQSSNILSRPYDTSSLGVTYACLQKNLGPSGYAVVVVRTELCGDALPITPVIWDYAKQAGADSMINTIATFQLRMLELMLDWISEQGGPADLGVRNQAKAQKLYEYIDGSDMYSNNVDAQFRSRMNVPFVLSDSSLDDEFVAQSEDAGLIGLRGHRAVGGMRASIYNAMPMEGIDALIEHMRAFEASHG